jgi:hypothetical protein
MPIPTNEVVFFDPAAPYEADPTVATEAFKLVLQADGAIPWVIRHCSHPTSNLSTGLRIMGSRPNLKFPLEA